MNFLDRIKLRSARAFYNACKRVGTKGLFSNRGETPVEIVLEPGKVTRALHKAGSIQEEHTTQSFAVPMQYDCDNNGKNLIFPPPGGISTGAELTYKDQIFTVQLEGAAFDAANIESVYRLTATVHIPRRANP
jgi:hypothetical protein